jgi:hypothetical protein
MPELKTELLRALSCFVLVSLSACGAADGPGDAVEQGQSALDPSAPGGTCSNPIVINATQTTGRPAQRGEWARFTDASGNSILGSYSVPVVSRGSTVGYAFVAYTGSCNPNATTVPSFSVTGSVAVNEPASCDGGGNSGDLTTNQDLSWAACHALKEHVDANGKQITANAFVSPAFTPVPATIRVQLSCYYANGVSDFPPKIYEAQTSSSGAFTVAVPEFACAAPAAQGVGVIVSAALVHDIDDKRGHRIGTVRALWDQDLAKTVYNSILSSTEPPLFMTDASMNPTTVATPGGHNWVIPRLVLSSNPLSFPVPTTVALGPQNFFASAAPTFYDYVRGMLQAFHTAVGLHRKLQTLLPPATYAQMFLQPALDNPSYDAAAVCDHCYTLLLGAPSGTDSGGYRSFTMSEPQVFSGAEASIFYGTMVSWGLPGHEFGHTLAATLASNTFPIQDNTMQVTLSPQGVEDGSHRPFAFGSTIQQQEMGQAMVEGIADAMGSFFLSDCNLSSLQNRMLGDLNPLDNMWDPQNFTWCDTLGEGCPYGAFRFQMQQRNIAENSDVWNQRLSRLTSLAQQASSLGENMVTSNNEIKYRNLFCDLLVRPNVSFAAGLVGGKSYVADYTWQAAEILDGRTPPAVIKSYAADPTTPTTTIGMATLFAALDAFVPAPGGLPLPLWIPGTITDGANQAYNGARLSVNGALSPQAFGLYLVNHGSLSKAQLNNLLRLNLMDEVN